MPYRIPLKNQLDCIQRELKRRRINYPKLVQDERLTQTKSDTEIDTMLAVSETLQRLIVFEEISIELREPKTTNNHDNKADDPTATV